MADLISRQAAIDYCYALINAENPSDPSDEWNYSQERINQTEVILHHLEFMPSAQPETHEERTETHGVCLDTISRQEAIDAVEFGITYAKAINKSTGEVKELFKECNKALNDAVERIKDLPPAQSEHTSNNDCNGCKFVGCYDTDFPCANCIRKNKDYYAPERRTDEV